MSTDLFEQLQASLGDVYALERELGGGGMSRVFLAEERRFGRRVVVKVLIPELAAEVSTERFQREIRVAARLQDPRIVPVLNAGDAGGVPFYTMPYVEGESLRARLVRGQVPHDLAFSIVRDILLALDAAHTQGVVHRDVKPENVLLSGRTAMVTDFGIAKAVSAASGRTEPSTGTLTALGTILGTPAYMSPEQATGGTVDHRSDLYAWGVIAYELFARAHPFGERRTPQAMVAAHITERPPSLATRARALPTPLVDMVERTLAKDPDDRPQSAAEILRVLDATSSGAHGSIVRRLLPVAWPARVVAGLAIAGVVAGVAALALRRSSAEREGGVGSGSGVRSLAVLPFRVQPGDTADAYFAEGMADELTIALAKEPGLRVAARSSAFRFRGDTVNVRAVGDALGVEAVLEGTTRRFGDRLRVAVNLTSAADGKLLWGEIYERARRDVFAVQDEITRAIVTALRGTLAVSAPLEAVPSMIAKEAPRGAPDLEAYDLYLKGRFDWSKRGERGLRSAIGYFSRAITRDPTFARAHAGLAMAYVVLPIFSPAFPADSGILLAERSAGRALALDSTLADAHLARAYALKMQWRFREAERYFRNALALAPDDATAHHWFGVQLYALGRVDESARELARARELDPFGSTIGTDGAIALYGARRFGDALAEIRRAWALDSAKSDTYVILGLIQLASGRPDSALRALEKAHRLGTGFDIRPYVSVAYRKLGRVAGADSIYAALRRDRARGRALDYDVAIAATAAGETSVALTAIERTLAERHMLVTEMSLPCDPLFDGLKSDPRFGRLLERVGMRACAPRSS